VTANIEVCALQPFVSPRISLNGRRPTDGMMAATSQLQTIEAIRRRLVDVRELEKSQDGRLRELLDRRWEDTTRLHG